MRALFYGVLNTKTNEKISVGVYHHKAVAKMEELKKANPNGEYKIVYKYGSI